MRLVAVLCAARNSVYHQMDGLEVYDIDRDARTFEGGMPVIAHPPCRHWSLFCRQQAKQDTKADEQALGLWCLDQVKQCGGVIEQPWGSKLFAHLPEGAFKLSVPQYWFGYPTQKSTWLAFYGCQPGEIPYRLHDQGDDRRRMAVMSKNQRSETTPAFAQWLVEIARSCYNS